MKLWQTDSRGNVVQQDEIIHRLGEAGFLEAILDSTDAIVIVTNPKGAIQMVNAAFERKTGFDEREARGRPVWAFRAFDEVSAARKSFFQVSDQDTRRPPASRWRTKDDGLLLLSWSVRIMRDCKGKEIARVGTAMDVTPEQAARSQAEEAERERQMLVHLTDNLSEPLFFISPDGMIKYASRAVQRVYGYAPEELVGKPSSILRPDDRTERMAEYMKRLQASGEPEMLETEALHRDGERIPVELRTSPIHDSDGNYLGLSAVVYDMKDRRELEEELRRLAGTDPLTGVANRLGFKTVAEHEVKRARRYHHPLSVFVADIDHFKRVNDTYGHAIGDVALVRFAEMMGWSLRRPIDHIARTGGEEFVAILPETDREGGIRAAERVRESTEINPIECEDVSFNMTASFGVSSWFADEEDLGEAVQRADEALYEAKETGRNKVVYKPSEAESADGTSG
ncbi:diguanylate cyclase [Minwuia sp.]|uniref:GGDEF domain-containing protein n=1 Tax=Minwuia sp. TaxID=2493630 RepID=UPI003A95BFD8